MYRARRETLFAPAFLSKIPPFTISWRDISECDLRADLLQSGVDSIHILFFVEDQICKFFFTVHEDQTVIKICGTVVRLHDADSGEAPVDVLVGDAVFSAEIPVIQAELTEPDSADLFRAVIIVNVCRVVNCSLIDSSESQLAKSEHSFTFAFLKRTQRYHFLGRLMAMSVPIMPAIVPVMKPPITSVG